MHHETNTHHLVPKSKGGSNNPNNLSRTIVEFHSAIHRVFDNRLPHEQFKFLLSVNSTALTEEFRSDIIHLLNNKERDYFYKQGVFKT